MITITRQTNIYPDIAGEIFAVNTSKALTMIERTKRAWTKAAIVSEWEQGGKLFLRADWFKGGWEVLSMPFAP